jgi:hypothetical protein
MGLDAFEDQQSKDSAIRFSPASLSNSGGFVFVIEGLLEILDKGIHCI